MAEFLPDRGQESNEPQPHGLGIELPAVPLRESMTITDLQEIINTVLGTIELPAWIEPDKIVATAKEVVPGVGKIYIILFTFLSEAQHRVLEDSFKAQLNAALREQQKLWKADHS